MQKFVRLVGTASVLAMVFLMPCIARADDNWSLDISNDSDSCAHVTVNPLGPFVTSGLGGAPIHGNVNTGVSFDLVPHASRHLSGEAVRHSIKVYAYIGAPKCQQPYRQPDLHDNIPSSGKSQLSIHKQNGSYIMRHGR
jgi:hypothetical protein